jgi:hypothetical protein
MKCPSQSHGLNVWSPDSCATLEGSGNFRRWDLAGERRSLGMGP